MKYFILILILFGYLITYSVKASPIHPSINMAAALAEQLTVVVESKGKPYFPAKIISFQSGLGPGFSVTIVTPSGTKTILYDDLEHVWWESVNGKNIDCLIGDPYNFFENPYPTVGK